MHALTKVFRESLRQRRIVAGTGGRGQVEAMMKMRTRRGLAGRISSSHAAAVAAGGFERMAQRILREAGFVDVTVTGKSGDGGIDGVGTYRLSLVSFPVVFPMQAI